MQAKDNEIVYNGQLIQRDQFRAFIYNKDGITRKLVENYDEFEAYLSSGLWFDCKPLNDKEKESKPMDVKKHKR